MLPSSALTAKLSIPDGLMGCLRRMSAQPGGTVLPSPGMPAVAPVSFALGAGVMALAGRQIEQRLDAYMATAK